MDPSKSHPVENPLWLLFEDKVRPGRCKTYWILGASLLLAIPNALISVVMVALAVPGSGDMGPGFKVIAGTFLFGNVAGILLAAVLSTRKNWLVQVLGLTTQLLTIPLCLGLAVLTMVVLGIEDL